MAIFDTGYHIEEFEHAVTQCVDEKYVVDFSKITLTLHRFCYVTGFSSGDEVITKPITFVTTYIMEVSLFFLTLIQLPIISNQLR